MTDWSALFYLRALLECRLLTRRGPEHGEVTEKVIITAIFAALAIAAGAVIVAKVMAKANSIATQ